MSNKQPTKPRHYLTSLNYGHIAHRLVKDQEDTASRAVTKLPPLDPIAIVTAGGSIERTLLDKKVQEGVLFGSLTKVRTRAVKSILRDGRTQLYRMKCKCGNEVILPASGVIERKTYEVGCLGPKCTYSAVPLLVWHNTLAGLWFQFGQLWAHHRTILEPSWGGADKEDIALGLDDKHPLEAWQMFSSEIYKIAADLPAGTHWLHHAETSMPLGMFSVELKAVPNLELAVLKAPALFTGSDFVPMEELFGPGVKISEVQQTFKSTFMQFAKLETDHERRGKHFSSNKAW